MHWTLTFMAFLLLALPMQAQEKSCDAIDDLTNKWHDLSAYVDEHETDGFSPEETAKVDGMIDELMEPTQEYAEDVASFGDEDEQELAFKLTDRLEVLSAEWAAHGAGEWKGDPLTYLVAILEASAAAFDNLADLCDG